MTLSSDKLLYYVQAALGQIGGRALFLAAKIAAKRHDMHEFAHLLSAIMAGNTTECRYDLDLCHLFEPMELSFDEEDGELLGDLTEFDMAQWLDEIE